MKLLTMVIGLSLCFSLQYPLQAETLPNDQVTIMTATDAALDFKIYKKPFKSLNFAKPTQALIKKLDSGHLKRDGASYRIRLTHIRIVGDEVQYLIFVNELGDTDFYSLDRGKVEMICHLTMTGNGFSACRFEKEK